MGLKSPKSGGNSSGKLKSWNGQEDWGKKSFSPKSRAYKEGEGSKQKSANAHRKKIEKTGRSADSPMKNMRNSNNTFQ